MTASAGTLTLPEFLTARLDEDEAVARSARWHAVDYNSSENEAHGQRWDPARVLAEVEAKRRIVALHEPYSHGDLGDLCLECAGGAGEGADWPCRTLRILASVYASHKDYRDEWAL